MYSCTYTYTYVISQFTMCAFYLHVCDLTSDETKDNGNCVFIFLSSDPSFIPSHVIPVFQAFTGQWERIGNVPHARAQLIRERFSVPDQKTEAGRYYALYDLNPNWKTLSASLYSAGETEALQIARTHIQTVTGTCTCTPYMELGTLLLCTRD